MSLLVLKSIYISIFLCAQSDWRENGWQMKDLEKKIRHSDCERFLSPCCMCTFFFFLVACSKPLIDNLHTCCVCSICHVRNAPVSVQCELVHDHSRLYDSYTYLQWADTELLARSSWNCTFIRYRPTCNRILNCIKSLEQPPFKISH